MDQAKLARMQASVRIGMYAYSELELPWAAGRHITRGIHC